MQALVLEPDLKLNIRDIEIDEMLGPHDVRIAIRSVGVCGSDVHYYETGVLNNPQLLSPGAGRLKSTSPPPEPMGT